jgi:hypothetical protein
VKLDLDFLSFNLRHSDTEDMKWCIAAVTFLFMVQNVWAGDNFSKIHVFQTYYSGEAEKTFSNDNAGAGLEIIASTLNETFNWTAKGRLTQISGSQDFSDGGTSRNSSFTFEGGFTVYPLMKKKRAVSLYFGALGLMSFNYLKLDSTSFTVLHPSYQSTSFGFTGVVGLEWYLFGSDRWCLSAEFAQRYETASLAKQSSFNLGGFSLAVGVGW